MSTEGTNLKKYAWFDARNLKKRDILQLVYELCYDTIVVNVDYLKELKMPKMMKLVIQVKNVEEISTIPADAVVLSDDEHILNDAKNKKYKTAFIQKINSGEGMEKAWRIGIQHDYFIVLMEDTTNIPLELFIARFQNKKTQLIKAVTTSQEAITAFGVMEKGCNGVMMRTENYDEIVNLNNEIMRTSVTSLPLVKGIVKSVEHIGMGERVCIDTVSVLGDDEGMIIGSTSNGGILVSSETHYMPYIDLRPFRVNAGAVHSYVWVPENDTNYLTELKAGKKVLCVRTDGTAREVVVGRIKLETRPLLKIEVEAEHVLINVIVQDDWHIRIFGYDKEVRNVSLISPGDELLVYVCPAGRHIGIKIDEKLIEC